MSTVKIPMFPLSIFPLPGELVPLHIFEPRYRQLLEDAEARDISFGIYLNHLANTEKLGSLVKLESVIKRYPSGESDIIVKCSDLFTMTTLFRTFSDKLYPGGEVTFWNADLSRIVDDKLAGEFTDYLQLLKITQAIQPITSFGIANELSLSIEDRLKFVVLDDEKKENFLTSRIRYQSTLLREARKAKDVFHLN
ncbi:MAG TPA: LON peptidase substrate-binding domain-containing protein [Cyclobacteriaceae bacterium]|nr:LON peptidase substrate-binding domain-containing protein [Cyclobacteriaceae bacterium]